MPLLIDEISDDFDIVKTQSYMMKLDTETAAEILHELITNMDLVTNLATKISTYKRKNKAEIFNEKVVVGSQKTKVSIYVTKIKNTKNTYQVTYDIDLPSNPIVNIILLLMLIGFTLAGGLVGLGIFAILCMMFSPSKKKKIQKIFPIKSILHDAILKLENKTNE